jgi:translation initiation factor eIF-2B subunit epsilon
MSHKGKNSATSAKGKKPAKAGAESKSEDVLQAVVSQRHNASLCEIQSSPICARFSPTRSKTDSAPLRSRNQE